VELAQDRRSSVADALGSGTTILSNCSSFSIYL
jgi:hypothetical protein